MTGIILQRPAKVTIKELAKALSLSPMAVSVALNGSTGTVRVSEKTVKRVRKLAEEWKYKPNAGARAIRARQFRSVGFFDGADPSVFLLPNDLELGISDRAAMHDYNVNVVRRPIDPVRDAEMVPRIFREYQVDVLLATNTHLLTPKLIDRILTSGYPVVYVNEKRPYNAVYFDDYTGFRDLTMHMIQKGLKRITYLGYEDDAGHYSSKDRLQGYRDAMQAAGLPVTIQAHQGLLPERAAQSEDYSWLSGKNVPEAVLCYDDVLALKLERACLAKGVRIPDDMALAGCGGHLLHSLSLVPMTILELSWIKLGQAAVEMSLDIVLNKKDQVLSLSLLPEIKERASTQLQRHAVSV